MTPEEFDKALDESSLDAPHVRAVVEAGPPEPPPPSCWSCMDYGYIDIFDNNDAVIRTEPCPSLGDPRMHPPSTPVPLQITDATGHLPDCDGTCHFGYPDGCPPF